MSQFKCVAQTNGIRGLTHKNASSPRCGGSVCKLSDFCRAGLSSPSSTAARAPHSTTDRLFPLGNARAVADHHLRFGDAVVLPDGAPDAALPFGADGILQWLSS